MLYSNNGTDWTVFKNSDGVATISHDLYDSMSQSCTRNPGVIPLWGFPGSSM